MANDMNRESERDHRSSRVEPWEVEVAKLTERVSHISESVKEKLGEISRDFDEAREHVEKAEERVNGVKLQLGLGSVFAWLIILPVGYIMVKGWLEEKGRKEFDQVVEHMIHDIDEKNRKEFDQRFIQLAKEYHWQDEMEKAARNQLQKVVTSKSIEDIVKPEDLAAAVRNVTKSEEFVGSDKIRALIREELSHAITPAEVQMAVRQVVNQDEIIKSKGFQEVVRIAIANAITPAEVQGAVRRVVNQDEIIKSPEFQESVRTAVASIFKATDVEIAVKKLANQEVLIDTEAIRKMVRDEISKSPEIHKTIDEVVKSERMAVMNRLEEQLKVTLKEKATAIKPEELDALVNKVLSSRNESFSLAIEKAVASLIDKRLSELLASSKMFEVAFQKAVDAQRENLIKAATSIQTVTTEEPGEFLASKIRLLDVDKATNLKIYPITNEPVHIIFNIHAGMSGELMHSMTINDIAASSDTTKKNIKEFFNLKYLPNYLMFQLNGNAAFNINPVETDQRIVDKHGRDAATGLAVLQNLFRLRTPMTFRYKVD